MCRGKDKCTELGEDQSKWDKYCPLRPPEWIDAEITKFSEAVEQLIEGNRDECLKTISTIRSDEFVEWYIEHGQMSGRHRKNATKVSKPQLISEELRDPLRAPKKYQEEVFKRDGYQCRYCGNKLISQKFLKEFIKKLDSTSFQRGKTNLTTHAIIHAAWPVADHVIPWNIGGKTNLDNLVASCAACNYGKDGYTCEQMGIENPMEREPKKNEWDGLVSQLEYVKKIV